LKLVELDLGFKGYPFGTAIIHPAWLGVYIANVPVFFCVKKTKIEKRT